MPTTVPPLPPLDALVVKISDGDTFKISIPGTAETATVRLACVDAPEKKDQPGGVDARIALQTSLPIGSIVQIAPTGPKDRYGRIVGFVFRGKTNVNLEQVATGRAWVYTAYLKTCPQYADRLNAAQEKAKLARLGLWGKESCPPWEWRINKCMSLPDCKPVPLVRPETAF